MQPDTSVFTITDRALDRLRAVAADEAVDLAGAYLRVAVLPGGCSGLTYALGWDTTVQPADTVVDLGPVRLLLDARSEAYVEGTELDFSDGFDGKGFHFINPQAARTCACGESFGL